MQTFLFYGPKGTGGLRCGRISHELWTGAQAEGRCAVSEDHKVGGAGFYELLPPDMNNEDIEGRVCCFHTAVAYSVFPLCS